MHMLLQRKKANSLVPTIFSPLHGLLEKGGGIGAGLRFSFHCHIYYAVNPCLRGKMLVNQGK